MQAVVLEGKYWRRRIEAVAEEYHKWRLWYRMRRKRQQQVQAGEARQPEVVAGPPVTDDMTLWDLNLGGWHLFGGWRGRLLASNAMLLSAPDIQDSLFTSHHEVAHPQSREWHMGGCVGGCVSGCD